MAQPQRYWASGLKVLEGWYRNDAYRTFTWEDSSDSMSRTYKSS